MIERLGKLTGRVLSLAESAGVRLYRARGLAGSAIVAYGAWLIYEPAGIIIAGVALIVDGVMDR